MTGSLALDLWILLPISLFALLVLYVVCAGRRMGGVNFRVPRARPARSRRALLINVVSRDLRPARDITPPAEPAGVGEPVPAAMGPQRPQA